jgi:hypothetical protein
MTERSGRGGLRRWWWVIGLGIAVVVVIVLAPLASADPDGLERVATDDGFLELGQDAPFEIIPDYTVPGLDGNVSTILAGLVGVVVVFGLMWLVGRALARRRGG